MSKTVSVLLAALVLVGGANLTAYAATGKPVLAGKTNLARSTTVIQSARGAALELRTTSTQPPLKVTSQRKVVRLNADQVDGVEAAALRTVAVSYTLEGFASGLMARWTLTGLPAGTWDVTGSIPIGTTAGVQCSIADAGGVLLNGSSTPVFGQVDVPLLGPVRGGSPLTLACNGLATMTQIWTEYPMTLRFTRIDTLSTRTGQNVPVP